MPEQKKERMRHIACALLAFGEDTEETGELFTSFMQSSAFDEFGAAFMAGQGCDTELVAENIFQVMTLLPDAGSRVNAVLASSTDVGTVLEKYNTLDERFRKEQYMEVDSLPLSIVVRLGRRGIGASLFQYKMLKKQDEELDEISVAILTTFGDVGAALERYRLIKVMDPDLPMQSRAVLTAFSKDYTLLKEAYAYMKEEQKKCKRAGLEPFDNMVAAILALPDNSAETARKFEHFRNSDIWE